MCNEVYVNLKGFIFFLTFKRSITPKKVKFMFKGPIERNSSFNNDRVLTWKQMQKEKLKIFIIYKKYFLVV